MTFTHFTNQVDGLLNDFVNGASDEKEFRDGILELLIKVAENQLESKIEDPKQINKNIMLSIDELISKLQVHNYQIGINNFGIGDFHNLHVSKFESLKVCEQLYRKKEILIQQFRMPAESTKLIELLETLLKHEDKN